MCSRDSGVKSGTSVTKNVTATIQFLKEITDICYLPGSENTSKIDEALSPDQRAARESRAGHEQDNTGQMAVRVEAASRLV
jgi:hypothetical protein